MSATFQYQIGELLERAGARPRGNRHDCPKCSALRTVTHTPECFFCHRCGWRGNAVTLARELGIDQRIPSVEYRELCQRRERAREAGRRRYHMVHKRRMELLDMLHDLNRVEALAHDAGPTDASWESLALVYEQRPVIERELDSLELPGAAALVQSMSAMEAV